MRRDRHQQQTSIVIVVKEILFVDALNLGHLVNRRTKVPPDDDIKTIADTLS